jgi:hypothetical protein
MHLCIKTLKEITIEKTSNGVVTATIASTINGMLETYFFKGTEAEFRHKML